MVYFNTNILICRGFMDRCNSLSALWLRSVVFYRYANVEIYLIAVTLLNAPLFPEIFRWVLGNSEMKLYNL